MEGISRKDLNTACDILKRYGNEELAKKIRDFDVIPKLYVYTYFKKIYNEFKTFRIDKKDFDFGEFEALAENLSGLQLEVIRNKREARIVFDILSNGMKREKQFCDFDDSRFHGQKKTCACENEEHFEDIEPSQILSEKDMKEFDKLSDEKGWHIAIEKFNDQLNPVTECVPFYQSDDETRKWDDDPTWTCKICEDRYADGDYDFDVSCDMEMES